MWHTLCLTDILDVGDIIGVLFRIDHKETFLSKKPKWSLHSISIETCRKLSNEQGKAVIYCNVFSHNITSEIRSCKITLKYFRNDGENRMKC